MKVRPIQPGDVPAIKAGTFPRLTPRTGDEVLSQQYLNRRVRINDISSCPEHPGLFLSAGTVTNVADGKLHIRLDLGSTVAFPPNKVTLL